MVVVVMREEDGGRPRMQRAPERRNGHLSEPGHQPWVEEEELILLPVQKRGMAEVDDIPVLRGGEPAGADRRARSDAQAVIGLEVLEQAREVAGIAGPRFFRCA